MFNKKKTNLDAQRVHTYAKFHDLSEQNTSILRRDASTKLEILIKIAEKRLR